jgi:hypothetical protein
LSPPNPRAIELNTLIEQVISLQAPGARNKEVAIVCELNLDLSSAFAEAVQIQQVLFNLLVGADEAMSPSEKPKKLTPRTDFTDDHVGLESKTTVVVSPVWSICLKQSSRTNQGEQSSLWHQSFRHRGGGTLEAIRREGGVTFVRIELSRFSSRKPRPIHKYVMEL